MTTLIIPRPISSRPTMANFIEIAEANLIEGDPGLTLARQLTPFANDDMSVTEARNIWAEAAQQCIDEESAPGWLFMSALFLRTIDPAGLGEVLELEKSDPRFRAAVSELLARGIESIRRGDDLLAATTEL